MFSIWRGNVVLITSGMHLIIQTICIVTYIYVGGISIVILAVIVLIKWFQLDPMVVI